MKPIKLRLSGLQSFKDTQEIEFSKLEDLFIITGETGSGKSTILDAMILALYNKIPRNEEGESSSKDTLFDNLNNSCTEMFVEFTFQINDDIYQIKRSYDYKESRKNKFNSKDPLLIKNDEIIASKNNEVRDVLNIIFPLSYEDFTKTVILVQNKFSDFIKLKNKDKRDMLENIFDLTKYGDPLSRRIKTELDNNLYEIEELKTHIDNTFTTEVLAFLSKEIQLYNKRIKKYDSLVSKIKNQQEIKKTLEEYQLKLDKLKQQDIDSYINKINLHDKFKEFKPLVDNKKRFLKDINEAKTSLDINTEKKVHLEESLTTNKTELTKLSLNYQEQKKQLQLIDYSYAITQELNEKLSLKKEQEQYNAIINEVNDLTKTIDSQQKIIEANELQLTELNSQEKFDIEELNTTLVNVSTKINMYDEYTINLKSTLDENLNLKKQMEENFIIKEEKVSKLSEVNAIISQNKAVGLALTLNDNTPCPVCGSLDHPSPATDLVEIDHDDLIEALTNKIDKLNLAISNNSSQIENNNKIITQINEFMANNKKEQLLKQQEQTKNYILKYNELNEKLSSLQISIKKTSEYITKMQEQLAEKQSQLASLEKCNQVVINETISEIKTLISQNEQKRINSEKISNNLLTLKDEINKCGSMINSLEIKIENTINLLAKITLTLIKLNNDLTEVNEQLPENIDEISESILEKTTYEEYNLLISTHQTELAYYQTNIKEYQLKVDEQVEIDKLQYYEKLKKDTSLINLKLENLYSDEVQKNNKLTEYTKKLNLLRTTQKSYEGIYNVIKKQNFVEHLAGFKLKSILLEASKRLSKITNGRYELILVNNIEFELIDNLNNGTHRKTTTLSGGETFMVSLCLALALSNQVQVKNKTPLEFFFLDEGFGTLDENSLNKVINTLEELRSLDNLKIGLISHVDSLKEKINSKIIVTKADEISGSTLKITNY